MAMSERGGTKRCGGLVPPCPRLLPYIDASDQKNAAQLESSGPHAARPARARARFSHAVASTTTTCNRALPQPAQPGLGATQYVPARPHVASSRIMGGRVG